MENILRPFSDGNGNKIGYHFWCPGCEDYHGVWVYQSNSFRGSIWSFNENMEKPTFAPSLLVRSGHYSPDHKGDCWCDYKRKNPDKEHVPSCYRCHSFIREGQIQFLGDCTHALAGKTVPLVPDPNE